MADDRGRARYRADPVAMDTTERVDVFIAWLTEATADRRR
jgi:hypothetical protein